MPFADGDEKTKGTPANRCACKKNKIKQPTEDNWHHLFRCSHTAYSMLPPYVCFFCTFIFIFHLVICDVVFGVRSDISAAMVAKQTKFEFIAYANAIDARRDCARCNQNSKAIYCESKSKCVTTSLPCVFVS